MSVYAYPGPDDIQRTRLPNGVQIWTRRNPNSPAVSLGGFLEAGSIFDPPGQAGLANFTASALLRGTQRYTFEEIFSLLEDAGAGLQFSTHVHTVSFHGRSLAEDLPLLLDLLAEALRHPVFAPQPLEQLRAELLTGFTLREQDTESMAALTFDRLIYGADHPYGRPVSGWKDTVLPLQFADLQAFHARHYGPRDLHLAVVGDIAHETVLDLAASRLADWDNPQQPAMPNLPPVTPPSAPRREHVPIPDKQQVDLVIGCLAPSRRDDDFLPVMLANAALGQFGMMGRIGDAVRRRSGLAYYAYSNLSASWGLGTWDVSAGVSPENFERAVALIEDEIRRFVDEGVTADELRDIKNGLLGRLPLAFESNAGIVSALTMIARYGWPLDYYRTYAERIQAIDLETVNAVARRYLCPSALTLTSAGTLETA